MTAFAPATTERRFGAPQFGWAVPNAERRPERAAAAYAPDYGCEPRQTLARGGLSPWQLRRVLDHLGENLAEDLPLRALANLVGLSQSYFSRAFKASTGLAPHRWLVNARCDKAKQLLLENRLGLAEIALDAGFCDQAHFTRVFARTVGISPGAWRRARLS